jgi:phosphoribosylamine--glycine ligase
MGAYSGDSILTPAETLRIEDTIVKPVLQGMAEEGNPFQGILYFGLMLTSEGPKVLEFNVRLGDPETQALVMRSSGDLATTLYSVAIGELSADAVQWYPGAALCVVLATPGYPDQPIRGASIRGLEMAAEMKNVQVFHAGTRFREGIWETAGGRVLGVTGRGATLAEASMTAYEAVNRIHFEGMHYRRDIGAKGLHKIRKSGLTEE